HNVEVPLLLRRSRVEDGFVFIGVVAGGLDYGDVPALFPDGLGTEDLRDWNLEKAERDPLTFADAQHIAALVLQRRLSTIAGTTAGPCNVSRGRRDRSGFDPSFALRRD